jgi:hypothetical protein
VTPPNFTRSSISVATSRRASASATGRISSEAEQRDEAAQAFHEMGRRDAVLEAALRETPYIQFLPTTGQDRFSKTGGTFVLPNRSNVHALIEGAIH